MMMQILRKTCAALTAALLLLNVSLTVFAQDAPPPPSQQTQQPQQPQ